MLSDLIEALKRSDISCVIGGGTLVGALDGNPSKYSSNPTIYLLNPPFFKVVRLFFVLYAKGILLKPKNRGMQYKLKRKGQRGFLVPLKETKAGYTGRIKLETVTFPLSDLSPEKIVTIMSGVGSLPVPVNVIEFVKNHKRLLLSEYYQEDIIKLDTTYESMAVDLMRGVSEVAQKVGQRAWIEGGTLLGVVRDGKLIPWDHDVDMGMIFPGTVAMKQLIRSLKKKYLVSVRDFKLPQKGIWQLGQYRLLKIFPKKLFFLKHGLCCDLFIYYPGTHEENGERIYKYVVWDHNACHKAKHFDNLETVTCYESTFFAPAHTLEFLATKYGADWRTPKKTWNVALNDGSVIAR